MRSKGFTLIELLIVVAIIAILAAIAVPNFLEAQTRAKTSRVAADMRTIATGLESYFVDNNRYPPDRNYAGPRNIAPSGQFINTLKYLSSPIAYLTSTVYPDPFIPNSATGINSPGYKYFNTGYGVATQGNWGDLVAQSDPSVVASGRLPRPGWLLNSFGPDKKEQASEWIIAGLDYTAGGVKGVNRLYDPTNGTVSEGDIAREGGAATRR